MRLVFSFTKMFFKMLIDLSFSRFMWYREKIKIGAESDYHVPRVVASYSHLSSQNWCNNHQCASTTSMQ